MDTRYHTERSDPVIPAPPEPDPTRNRGPVRPVRPVRKDHRGLVGWSAAVLAFVLAAGLVLFLVSNDGGSPSTPTSTSALAATARGLVQSDQPPPASPASTMIASILPSVVNVRVTQVGTSPTGQFGETTAEGSGVIISSDGVIVTNNHVVENAVSVRVVFEDGHPTMTGTVTGTDQQHDLAIIKVDATGLKPVTLGRSNALNLADTVYAIGFPLDLGVTVTEGIVSGLNRSVSVQGNAGVEHLVGLLQTDAAINPGNSGGPLVDSSGQLVGINTAGASAASADNVGFAISIDDALPVIKQILTQPPRHQAWIGVEGVSVDSAATAAALGMDPSVRGAGVVGVVPSSPAAAAGIKPRDVIVSLDGKPIVSAPALTSALAKLQPGQQVPIGLVTPAGRRTVDVRLGQRPPG